VSVRLGNSNDICGGAAVVSTLVFQSATPHAARANADALRAAFNSPSTRVLLPADVRRRITMALENFEGGALSEEDVCYLQQASYAAGAGVRNEPSTMEMASLIADLVGYGATFDEGTSFVQTRDRHWVGSSAGQTFNSAPYDSRDGQVDVKTLTPRAREFSGRVRVLKDEHGTRCVQLQARFRKGATKGSGWQAEVAPRHPMFGSNAERLAETFRQVDQLFA
jgi:hypothetical protein